MCFYYTYIHFSYVYIDFSTLNMLCDDAEAYLCD